MTAEFTYVDVMAGTPPSPDWCLLEEEAEWLSQQRLYMPWCEDSDYVGFALTQDRRVCGAAAASLVEGYVKVERLMVRGDSEGKGVGAALLAKILEADMFSDCSGLTLTPTVASESFYTRLGLNPRDATNPSSVWTASVEEISRHLRQRTQQGKLALLTREC